MDGQPDHSGRLLDGRYRVLKRLGEGGMGTVYIAEHIGLKQRRAIKFLRQELAGQTMAVKRFLQEARVVSSLRHEHVISVVDMGHSGGVAYYVMELLDGEDLRAVLRRESTLPWSRVRTHIAQICDALALAHANGIVHRDLKPENCFCVRRPDGAEFVKLLDFGIAKVSKEAGGTQLTATGETLGTIGYMAPEQAEGRSEARSDIYAIGVMMYEMLAGRPPYVGTAIEILAKLMRGVEAQPLDELDPAIGPEVAALVHRAMHLEPTERFPDVLALSAAVAAIPAGPRAHRTAPTASSRPRADPTIDAAGPTVLASPPAAAHEVEDRTEVFVVRRPPTTPPRHAWLQAVLAGTAAALTTAGALGWLLFGTAESVAEPAPVAAADTARATVIEPTATPVAPPVVDPAPASDPPSPPAAPAVIAPPEPQLASSSSGDAPEPESANLVPTLSRKALTLRLTQRLTDCRPDLMSETIRLRVHLDDNGRVRTVTLIDPARLRPKKIECVEKTLKSLPPRIPEVIDGPRKFEVPITLSS